MYRPVSYTHLDVYKRQSQETDRESAANSANFKEYETFFTVRAYNGSVAVFKDGNDVPLYCCLLYTSLLTR